MKKNGGSLALCAFALAFCITFGAVFASVVEADEVDFPTLFCNDEVWYEEDIFPLERYYQSFYMPSSLLEAFDGINIVENDRLGTLLITYSVETVRFISFNTKNNFAMTDERDEFYVVTYKRGTERYIPVETVCNALGIKFDLYADIESGHTALRLCDGNEKKSFSELIDAYIIDTDTDTTVEGGDTTEPPDIPPIPLDAKKLYIIFDGIDASRLDAVICELAKHSLRATFFVEMNDPVPDVEYYAKIVAAGHSVGLTFNADGYEVDPIDSFAKQNDTLMRVLKYKVSFCRVYGTEGTDVYESAKNKAYEGGYTVWNDVVDLSATDQKEIVANLAAIDFAILNTEVPIFSFSGEGEWLEMLVQGLEHLNNNIECNAMTINNATLTDQN